MKVLMLGGMPNPDYPNKGIFNQRAAQSIGKQVDLVAISVRMWKPGRKFREVEQFENYKVVHLAIPHYWSMSRTLHFINHKIWTWFILLFAKGQLKDRDLIHSISGGYGYSGSQLSSKLKIKHLLQVTGSDVNSEYPQLLGSRQIAILLKNTHAVVGNSKRLVSDFRKLFDSRIPGRHIYRGVDLNLFDFQDIVESNNKFLFIGGLDAYPFYTHKMNTKGGLTLMSAWRLVEEQLNGYNAQLLFGGPCTPNEHFENWKSTLKYPEAVTSIGTLNPDKVREAYNLIRFVVLPSMEEGLPNVAVEASAKGKIVIGSNVGGVPEVVIHEQTGFVFKSGDEAALADYLVRACRLDSGQLREMSEHARRHIEQVFDASRYGEKYYSLYQELCAE